MQSKLELKKIASLGRTFDEYVKLFALDKGLLKNKTILDTASGCSSFCCEANDHGYKVTASDPIYNLDPAQIKDKFDNEMAKVAEQLPNISHLYTWSLYKNVEEFDNYRQNAFDIFIKDYKRNKNRYLPINFPKTDFSDNRFDIALASHFLFLWDSHLDYQFHLDTVTELLRIAKEETRIFPTVSMNGQKSAFVEPIVKKLESIGYSAKIKTVDYEVIKGGNQMLVIT